MLLGMLDKKGKLVTDLSCDDLNAKEDILSFRINNNHALSFLFKTYLREHP